VIDEAIALKQLHRRHLCHDTIDLLRVGCGRAGDAEHADVQLPLIGERAIDRQHIGLASGAAE
jgi:hypothetical protein